MEDKHNNGLHLSSGQFLNPGLSLAVLRRDPQSEYPLHQHEFDELVIVYSGNDCHFTPEQSGQVKTGDVYAIPSGSTVIQK